MGKTSDRVSEIAEPIVTTYGLELVDVDFVKEGDNWILRVFIDKPEGEVSLEDCEKVSNSLSERLDIEDPIEQSYILEVSSPGIERPLRKLTDYDRFVGELATIKTYAPIEGKKEFLGTILPREGEDIKLKEKEDGEEITIPFKKIAGANLTIDFG